jgi:hypothetical protein
VNDQTVRPLLPPFQFLNFGGFYCLRISCACLVGCCKWGCVVFFGVFTRESAGVKGHSVAEWVECYLRAGDGGLLSVVKGGVA